jgi:hypothetical protein
MEGPMTAFTEGRNGGSGHIVQVEEEGVKAVPVIRHHHLLVPRALVPQQQLCPEKEKTTFDIVGK